MATDDRVGVDRVQLDHDANFAYLSDVLARSSAGRFTHFWNLGYRDVEDVGACAVDPDGSAPGRGGFNTDAERLVRELVRGLDLAGRSVVDVGCGRGGALAAYRGLGAARVVGVDRSADAVRFTHSTGAAVARGDAGAVPIRSASVDVLTNLESSQFYARPDSFYAECARVLGDGGTFCYGDSFPSDALAPVRRVVASCGFSTLSERDITDNVLASRRAVAGRQVRALRNDAHLANFSGAIGNRIYDDLAERRYVYVLFRFRKDTPPTPPDPNDVATVRSFAHAALAATGAVGRPAH